MWPEWEFPTVRTPKEWRELYMSDPMTPEEKAWIDAADYRDLLVKWRFASTGDPYFIGETGRYYGDQMQQKRPANHAQISKEIGW